ncbi:MAG TPA: tetratricopeptide repeat protein [Chthoniobacterales bacterium]
MKAPAKLRLSSFAAFSLIILAEPVQAAPMDDFAAANTAFQNGQYQDAIREYETLVRQGENRPELFFNLGNAWQRAGNPAKAVVNYERALLLQPNFDEARANLRFVQDRLPSPPAPRRWWNQLPMFGINASVVTCIACLWLFLIFLTARWVRLLGAQNLWIFAAVLAAVGASLAGMSYWFRDAPLASQDRGIVVENSQLRSSFSNNSPVLSSVPLGSPLRIVSENAGWANCFLPDGTQGWIPANQIERVIPKVSGS